MPKMPLLVRSPVRRLHAHVEADLPGRKRVCQYLPAQKIDTLSRLWRADSVQADPGASGEF